MLAYFRVLNDMGWRTEPDAEFMRRVLSLHGASVLSLGEWSRSFVSLMPMLRRTMQCFEEGGVSQRAAILKHVHPVLNWLASDESRRSIATPLT